MLFIQYIALRYICALHSVHCLTLHLCSSFSALPYTTFVLFIQCTALRYLYVCCSFSTLPYATFVLFIQYTALCYI